METTLNAIASVAEDFHTHGIEPCDAFTETVIKPILTNRALLVLECLTKHSRLPIRITEGTTIDTLYRAGMVIDGAGILITRFGRYIYNWYLNHQAAEQPEPEPIDDVLTVLNNTTLMSELVRISIVGTSIYSGVSISTREKLVRLGFIEVMGYGLDFVKMGITERGKQAIRALRVGVVTSLHPGLVELLEGFNDKDECMLDNRNPLVCRAQQLILIQRPMIDPVGTVNDKVKYLLTQQGIIIKTILTI